MMLENDVTAFFALRQRVFSAVRNMRRKGEYGKVYEGAMRIQIDFGDADDERFQRFIIHLDCYLIGPARHYDWEGQTFREALKKAEKDIDKWIKETENDVQD